MMCLIAKLTPRAADMLRRLQDAALGGREGFAPLYGHITVASFVGEDEEGFIRDCLPLLSSVPPFTVSYRSVDILEATSVVVAKAEPSGGLLRLHALAARRFGPSLNRWTAGSAWVPHTTLMYGPGADLTAARDRARAAFVPFRTVIRRLEFSQVLENGYRIAAGVELPPKGSRGS